MTVRDATAADEAAIGNFLADLCLEARRLRFFSGAVDLAGAAHIVSAVDSTHRGLVAHDATGLLVGHATYVQIDAASAGVAVEVADHLHGRGLGTVLVAGLARIAEQHGIVRFLAAALAENAEMLALFRDGFDARIAHAEGSEQRVEFPTSSWRLARERFALATPPADPSS